MLAATHALRHYGTVHFGTFRAEAVKYFLNLIANLCARCRIQLLLTITKTRLYKFDPLIPHFYIVKLGFTGVYTIFLIAAQKHRLWVLVRTASPRRF